MEEQKDGISFLHKEKHFNEKLVFQFPLGSRFSWWLVEEKMMYKHTFSVDNFLILSESKLCSALNECETAEE